MEKCHWSDDSAMRDSLAAYLVGRGLAEERRGYGHATGEDVADAVFSFLREWLAGDVQENP